MFERFTARARQALVCASVEARGSGHPSRIDTEHLLLGLVRVREGVAARTLAGLGLDEATLRTDLARTASSDADVLRTIGIDLDEVVRTAAEAFGAHRVSCAMTRQSCGRPPFTARAKKVLERSRREALALGHSYIGTEHLLLALTGEGAGVAAQILDRRTAGVDAVRAAVLEALRSPSGSGS